VGPHSQPIAREFFFSMSDQPSLHLLQSVPNDGQISVIALNRYQWPHSPSALGNILAEHYAMAVGCCNHELSHPVSTVDRRLENDGAVGDEVGMKLVHAVSVQVGEPAMGADLGCRSRIWAFTEHDAHAVAPDKTPISGVRPLEDEAKGLAEVLGAQVYISHR
jgi:hypothetical protein